MLRGGQVLIVVLLVLAIGITVALAVSSRSVTEISVSTTQDESSRALEAAQVGLEKYLAGAQAADGPTGELADMNATYLVPAVSTAGLNKYYQLPYMLTSGEVATIDLNFSLRWGIDLCWCQADDSCPATIMPKIEVTFFYHDANGQYIKRKLYQPYGDSDAHYEGFLAAANTSLKDCGTETDFRNMVEIEFDDPAEPDYDLDLKDDNLDFVRIRMLDTGDYGVGLAAELIDNGKNFPEQYTVIESIGASGDTVQKIKATVMVYDLPDVFEAAVFSGGNLNR